MSGCGLCLFPVAVVVSVSLCEEVTTILALTVGHGLLSLELFVCGLVWVFLIYVIRVGITLWF